MELAACIPVRHKLAGGGKGILKEAARKVVPSAVIDRPRVTSRCRAQISAGQCAGECARRIVEPCARERGLFQQDMVDRLLADPMVHITPLRGSKLWQLGLLEQAADPSSRMKEAQPMIRKHAQRALRSTAIQSFRRRMVPARQWPHRPRMPWSIAAGAV